MFEEEIQEIESQIYKDNADYESIIDTLDFILSDNKENVRALELKYFAAFAAEHYELCMKTCDEVLAIDTENIDALAFKANSLFRLERYPECEEISKQILKLDPEHKEALELKENSNAMKALGELEILDMNNIKDEPTEVFQSDYKPPVKKSFKRKLLESIIIWLLILVPLGFVYYLHPTKENMSCNKTFKCRINQTFWGNYTRIRIVTISNKFYFAKRTTLQPGFDSTLYNSYPIYKLENGKKISPFIYYSYQSKKKTQNINFMNKEYEKFLNYVNTPYRGYYARSKAQPSSVNIPFIGYLAYVIALFMLEKIINFIKTVIGSIHIKKSKRTKKQG